jgi:hypothetical protein
VILRGVVLYQPYAWAMFHGKDVENRSRRTNHRGPLLILAAVQKSKLYYDEAAIELRKRGLEPPAPDELSYGGIIGAVEIWGLVAPSEGTLGAGLLPGPVWHFPSKWGWLARKPVELPFRMHRGNRGIMKLKITLQEEHLLRAGGLLAAA